MAKAREIPGLNCSSDAVESAAQVLRVRFDEMVGFRTSALDFSDIKGVHDMRVATRRLRSALRDFSPLLKKETLQPLKTDLKQIADALGAVRDQDVAIDTLERLRKKAKKEQVQEGIEKLIEERRARREPTQFDLTKALAETCINQLQKRFTVALKKAAGQKNSAQSIDFKQAGRNCIAASLQDFCDLSPSIYEPFNGKPLHRLRILAKRLRYAIELFAVCWNKRIRSFAKEIAKMQTFLGEIHDCDVQIEILSRRLCESEAGDKSEQKSIEWLLSELFKERTRNYRGALRLWSRWKERDFIERLGLMIEK
jgi:CHAD domain-containing protein